MKTKLLGAVAVAALLGASGPGWAQTDLQENSQENNQQNNQQGTEQQDNSSAKEACTGASCEPVNADEAQSSEPTVIDPGKATSDQQADEGDQQGTKVLRRKKNQAADDNQSGDQVGDAPKANDDQGKGGTAQSDDVQAPDSTAEAEEGQPADSQQNAAGEDEGKRIKLSSTERQKASDTFRRHLPKRSADIDISVRIGVAVPRSVVLYDLPPDIITGVPQYRSYRYAYVGNSIYIIEPTTYVVVDIVPVRDGGIAIDLSADDLHFVFDTVPRDERRTDINLRLALGAELPDGVDLYKFPRNVRNQIPELGDYRYVVVQDEIIVVDPSNNEIVLVISE